MLELVRRDTFEKEVAASYETWAALWGAQFGNVGESRQDAKATLLLSSGRDVQYWVGLALAFTNDTVRSRALADDLDKRFPEDTLVRFNLLPTLNAMLVKME